MVKLKGSYHFESFPPVPDPLAPASEDDGPAHPAVE